LKKCAITYARVSSDDRSKGGLNLANPSVAKSGLVELTKQNQGIANEFAQLTKQLQASSFSPEQAELLKKFVREITGRLIEANNNFYHGRMVIDFLQVNNGSRVARP
jgi:hypothetical protein